MVKLLKFFIILMVGLHQITTYEESTPSFQAYPVKDNGQLKVDGNNLINEYGYGENASRSAKVIGYVEGEILSDSWNHSDDEMYFLTAPAFVNYAFDEKMKKKHLKAVTSHWQIERSEKNPLWNFLYSLSGGNEIDLEESIWWLKEYPLDLIDWRVENKHRKDLVKLNPNFRILLLKDKK